MTCTMLMHGMVGLYDQHGESSTTGGLLRSPLIDQLTSTAGRLLESDVQQAALIAREALLLAEQQGNTAAQGVAHQILARVAEREGTLLEAIRHLECAREQFSEGHRQGPLLDVLLALGELHLTLQQSDRAMEALQQANEECHAQRGEHAGVHEPGRAAAERGLLLKLEELLASTHEQLGNDRLALEHYRAVYALERALFQAESAQRSAELAEHLEVERARHAVDVSRWRSRAAQQAREEAQGRVRQRRLELELSQQEIVTRLALAAEYRDDVTGKHTWRVGYYAGVIAQALGMPEGEVQLIRVAARLHDVGKIGIPDAILLKPGKFTAQEYDHMKQHAAIGARILSGSRSEVLQLAEVIALSHHERWDGSGYPHGLAGEGIPLVGRIVAVADVLDALTHARPYKVAWTYESALAELAAQRGRQFDPRVLDAALAVFGEEGFFERVERELTSTF